MNLGRRREQRPICSHNPRDEFERFVIRALECIMAELDAITEAVANEATVEASAIALIQNLAAEISASAGDPAAVQALADQINQNATALASAVSANTPAAPADGSTPAATPTDGFVQPGA